MKSQQRSEHVNNPTNHKLITFSYLMWLTFPSCNTIHSRNIFRLHGFLNFTVTAKTWLEYPSPDLCYLVNDNWSIRKVTVKALILWERYRYTLFASQLVARPHSQGSLSKNSKQTILQGTKDNKTKKNIYSNLHTFAIWASLGVIRAGRNKDT